MEFFCSGLHPEFLLCKEFDKWADAMILAQCLNDRQNTGIKNVEGIKYINFGDFRNPMLSLDDAMRKILNELLPLSIHDICIVSFRTDGTYRAIIQPNSSRDFASAIVFSYMISEIIIYRKSGGRIAKLTTNWDAALI